MRHDFHPALGAIHAVETAGEVDGLVQARHVVCAAAEPIAHACDDLDADHAGPLCNKSEDRYQACIATAPQAMAALGNLTINVMRWAGENNIAPYTHHVPLALMGAGIGGSKTAGSPPLSPAPRPRSRHLH